MFTQADLLRLLHARPFTAFRLHLSDGGHADVLSHQAIVAGRRSAVIWMMEGDADRWSLVCYMHVTRVELLLPATPPAGPQEPPGEPAPVA